MRSEELGYCSGVTERPFAHGRPMSSIREEGVGLNNPYISC